MRGRKRVLLTASPDLVRGRRCMTQRALAAALDKTADLLVVPVGDYDFTRRRVRAYRRLRGGRFEDAGMIVPAADLWIVYTDGYYLNPRALGFGRRRDFFRAQLEFHHEHIQRGRVGRMVNRPQVEARTLKSWLAGIDAARYRVIPTRVFSSMEEVYACQAAWGTIVAKLDWGGAGVGACRLASANDVRWFEQKLADSADQTLDDFCFQPYRPGDEKRLWFAGGRFVAARRCHGRKTPWSDSTEDYDVRPYDTGTAGFLDDRRAAEEMVRLCGLDVGSVDFIGDRINEINGCGTVFTEYKHWQRIIDARPALATYFVELLQTL